METSQNTNNIFKAMIKAAPEITSISKSKQAYGYKYATLDSLIDMLRGVLPKYGLWFMQMPTRVGDKSTLTTRVFHDSGEWVEDCIEMTDTELQGKANDTQKIGASITYFRRYALSSIFGVAADEDVDGNLASKQQPQQRQRINAERPPQQAVKSTPLTPVTKQKIAPAQYLVDDYNRRAADGESHDSILSDYAGILKKENKCGIDELTADEQRNVAMAIYVRNQNASK